MSDVLIFVFLEAAPRYADTLARLQQIIGTTDEELDTRIPLGVMEPAVDPSQFRDLFHGPVLGKIEGCRIENQESGLDVLVADIGGDVTQTWKQVADVMLLQSGAPSLMLACAEEITAKELSACDDALAGLSFRFDRLVFMDEHGNELDSYELSEEDDEDDDTD